MPITYAYQRVLRCFLVSGIRVSLSAWPSPGRQPGAASGLVRDRRRVERRTMRVPGGALLVSVRGAQDCRLAEGWAEQLHADRQPVGEAAWDGHTGNAGHVGRDR